MINDNGCSNDFFVLFGIAADAMPGKIPLPERAADEWYKTWICVIAGLQRQVVIAVEHEHEYEYEYE